MAEAGWPWQVDEEFCEVCGRSLSDCVCYEVC